MYLAADTKVGMRVKTQEIVGICVKTKMVLPLVKLVKMPSANLFLPINKDL